MKFYIKRTSDGWSGLWRSSYDSAENWAETLEEVRAKPPAPGAVWVGNLVEVEPGDSLQCPWTIHLTLEELVDLASEARGQGEVIIHSRLKDGPVGPLPVIEIYDDYRE